MTYRAMRASYSANRRNKATTGGAKPHYVITDVDDRDYLSQLVKKVAELLPAKRK